MNTDHVIDKLARDISIGLQIGETQLWSALETITISGIEEVPDPGDSPTAVTVSTVRLTEVVPKSGLPFLLIEYVIERVWQVFGHFYVANWDLDNLAYQQKLQKSGSPLFKINKNAYGGVAHSLKSTKMHKGSPLFINKKCNRGVAHSLKSTKMHKEGSPLFKINKNVQG